MAEEIRVRRMRDLARERLAKARAEQVEIEEELRRADVTIRQGRARLAAFADVDPAAPDVHDAGASAADARTLASRRELIEDLARRLAESESEARGLSAALEAGQAVIAAARRQLDGARAEEANLRRDIETTRHAAIALSGELGDIHAQCADLQSRIRAEVESVTVLETELDTVLRRHDLVSKTRQATLERIAESERDHAAAESRRSDMAARNEALQAEIASLESDIAQWQARLEAARRERENLSAECARLDVRIAGLGADRATLASTLKAESDAAERVRRQLDEASRARAGLEQEIDRLHIEIRDLTRLRDAIAQESATARAGLADEQAARDDIERSIQGIRKDAATEAETLNHETAELARIRHRLRKVRAARERHAAELELAQSAGTEGARATLVEAASVVSDASFPSSGAPDFATPPIPAPALATPDIQAFNPRIPANQATRPGWRPRIALALAFGVAALAIYLVPRLWPGGRAAPETARPANATPAATIAVQPAELYGADPEAQRDLTLTLEMRALPERESRRP
jgi:chromosome segregation ATPase